MRQELGLGLAFAFAASCATMASAQTISVNVPAPSLGKVVSAPAGDTTFTTTASSGNISVTAGSGYRVSPDFSQVIVTVTCPNVGACNNKDVDVTISAIGSPTGRARALTNFTVASGTATIKTPPGVTGTNPITFQLDPVGRSANKYFYVGMDFPIAGDNSGLPTGVATSSFQINAQAASVNISAIGQAIATVFRPITITMTSNLAFGAVSRPFAGNGLVTLDAATGEVTVSGQGVQEMPGIAAPASAAYTVNGEGGQTFSISVPPSFVMVGPGGNLTVTTTSTAGTIQSFSGALGSAGSYAFKVGGSFPLTATTPTGAYSGTFDVVVNYN